MPCRAVDSTVVRAHQHAAGARGGTPRQGIGRSRGGLTTKIHLRTNGWGLPMRTDVTPGRTSDHKGFDADRIRDWAEARDAIPVIPMRRNRKARAGVDKTLYALRNLVERCFGRLKNSRRVATRYDKTATSFLGFVDIACIRLRIRRSVNTA